MRINLVRNICRLGVVGGIVGTAYFSAKNGEKICKACKEVNDESFGMTPKRKVGHFIRNTPRLIKPLGPTLLCATGTLVCVAVSERISYKQIAALTASCIYLTKNRDFLEGKLKEVVGEDTLKRFKEEFIKKEAAPVELSSINFPCIEETGKGDLLCFEGYSGRWFRSSKEACIEAQEILNQMYDKNIYCCMNDYYAALGITMTQFGLEYGWVNDCHWMPPEIRFTNKYFTAEEWNDYGPKYEKRLTEPVYVLEIDTEPMYSWNEV